MRSLFQSQTEPKVMPAGTPSPVPGPNAYEVCVISFDPDQNLLVMSMPNDVQMLAELDSVPEEGTGVDILLKDTKLGPRLHIQCKGSTPMPKFSSPEEADAWLEANS